MHLTIYVFLSAVILAAIVFCLWHAGSRRFQLPCPVWLRWMVELDNPFTKTCRAQTIIDHLAPKPGMTILDAGCGPGRVTIPLAKKVGASGVVIALDLQAGMLARVKQKADAELLSNIECLCAGLGDGKLGKDRFDAAVMVTVLGEIPDRTSALREIVAALKPGAILSITETVFDPHYQSQSKVLSLATAAGLTRIESFGNKIAYTLHFEKNHEIHLRLDTGRTLGYLIYASAHMCRFIDKLRGNDHAGRSRTF